MTLPVIAISADKGVPKDKLDKLSRQTALPLLSPKIDADFLLHITLEHLECRHLIKAGKKLKSESIYVDFVGGKTNHRRLHGGGKGQDIARAVGLHKHKNPTVLDLTAGMGGDAFVLASLGATVIMVERNPVIHALLDDALERASLNTNPELQSILNRLSLIKGSGLAILEILELSPSEVKGLNDLPDVIYLDPMFPHRKKSAQVKKEMQFFHSLVGEDTDNGEVLHKARYLAKKRIVVKRPRLADNLADLAPDFCISGKTTRYDIYLPRS